MAIYTRFGTPIVAFVSAIDDNGYVDLIADLGLNGLKEKSGIHISDLKADGGIEEIYALSDMWKKKYDTKETIIEITSSQSSYSFWGKHFGYRTNSNHVVSAIEITSPVHHYEILVFDNRGESGEPIWVSTIDEMIRKFSALVSEYTIEAQS